MKFLDVLDNQKLWSVVYEGESVDALTNTLSEWMDPGYLFSFFSENLSDLGAFFHITNVDQAIYDTLSDAASLTCLIMDISPSANLDELFRPLENSRMKEMILSKEKAKGNRVSGHPSWLRIYAIKLEKNIYLITGGAIKLTHYMCERQHTLNELTKMESVRNYLIEKGIFDTEGLLSYNKEEDNERN